MAAKLYYPTLIRLVRTVCIFTGRWDKQIRENLPEEYHPAYEAYKLACDIFLIAVAELEVVNP